MQRREFLKQGTMAGVLAGTGQLVQTPFGALPMAEAADAPDPTSLEERLDSRLFSLAEYDEMTPALTFAANGAAAARAWQRKARQRLVERVGGFPASRVPLRAEV